MQPSRADSIAERRREVLARLEEVERELVELRRMREGLNDDDEHDPEGATIAFERQQVAALLEQARRRLADVDVAVVAVENGTYGRCETCGRPIAPERLAARPTARSCIDCAR